MKDPSNRTKVVIRHLPPSLSHSSFFEQIDSRFSGRYNWCSFCPGKTSYKNQKYARAYVNFNSPDDVFDFSEFFNGRVFVNEKGAQFKAVVEYAPSQRVPKPNAKKDAREGTIYKDPEYVDFLERLSKPSENLPSADIQLERREAERAGVQEARIVTPLMEFVRKKRAAKSGYQRLAGSEVKAGGRSGIASSGKSRSLKQVSEKKKYILKASGKGTNGKDKSTYVLVPQRENQLDTLSRLENESGSVSLDMTKKRILLLKGKEQEISQRHDASGKIIRSILLNKEPRQSQSSSLVQTEQKLQQLNSEKGKRPPRPSSMRSGGQASSNEQSPLSLDYAGKRSVEDKAPGNEPRGFGTGREKHDRRTRSRDRLDRGVWTPIRHTDAPHAGDDYQSNILDSCEAKCGESKFEMVHSGRSTKVAAPAGGRNSSYTENGSHRHFGRRGPIHGGKDDGSSKRGGTAGHGLHEKQVWVQKSASGS